MPRPAAQRKSAQVLLSAPGARIPACQRLLEAEKRRSRELLRRNRELSLFGAVAAHDLQEPLRSLLVHLQRLESCAGAASSPELRLQLHRAGAAAQRMRRLLEASLAYARLDASAALESSELDCESCLREVLELLHADIAASGAKISWGRLPRLRAQPQLFSQLLQNLLGNGIKHRGRSAPEIHIGARRGPRSKLALLWVRDRGPGIPAEARARIFRPFSRLGGGVPGNGVGLALCKRIVELHGGRIWLRSRPGRGSSFYFTLPLEGKHGEPRKKHSPAGA